MENVSLDKRCRVTFLPQGVTVEAAADQSLLDVALEHGIELEHACGGMAACTTCRVIPKAGIERLSAVEDAERTLLDSYRIGPPNRLGCQAKVVGDVVVKIPDNDAELS